MSLAREMKKFAETGNDNDPQIIYEQAIAGILDTARAGIFGIVIEFDTDDQATETKYMLEADGFVVGEINETDHSIDVSWDV